MMDTRISLSDGNAFRVTNTTPGAVLGSLNEIDEDGFLEIHTVGDNTTIIKKSQVVSIEPVKP